MKNPKVGDRVRIVYGRRGIVVAVTPAKVVVRCDAGEDWITTAPCLIKLRKSPPAAPPEQKKTGLNLIEALKTGKPLRRPIAKHKGSYGDGWLSCEYVKSMLGPHYAPYFGAAQDSNWLIICDILAEDWEVKGE